MAKKPKTPNEIIEAIEDLHSQEQDLLEQLKKILIQMMIVMMILMMMMILTGMIYNEF